jgi:holo-[acyl-carrier protein] synthase
LPLQGPEQARIIHDLVVNLILKTGIDILEIPRIQKALERFGDRFLERIFSAAEIAECRGRIDSLAVHFSAKEAVVKALGTGIGPVGWLEVETLHKPSGEPYLLLHGRASRVAKTLGLTNWSVSLSHSHEYAIAVVVAGGEN